MSAYLAYTWSGFGNLGDDWIAEVGTTLNEPHWAREMRCFHPGCSGRRCLTGAHRARTQALVLWGGGWLAADRAGADTLKRWGRHLSCRTGIVAGFGLGLGPFVYDRLLAREVLARFDYLSVRCARDVEIAAEFGVEATLASDVVLLHTTAWAIRGEVRDYRVVSYPRYSADWLRERPWLTERFYRRYVTGVVRELREQSQVVFVEFGGAGRKADSYYWSDLDVVFEKPSTPRDAWSIISGAHQVASGRLHASLMAVVAERPLSAFAYHHKFQVLQELGLPVDGLLDGPLKASLPSLASGVYLGRVRKRGLKSYKDMVARVEEG